MWESQGVLCGAAGLLVLATAAAVWPEDARDAGAGDPFAAQVTVDAGRKAGVFPRRLLGVCLVPWDAFGDGLVQAMLPILKGGSVRIWGKDAHANLDRCMAYAQQTGVEQVVLFPLQEERRRTDPVRYRSADDNNLAPGQLPGALAEWLRYANHTPHPDYPEGYGIRYVEIWNEPYIDIFGAWDPVEYARYVSDCSRAVRAVDPTIHLGAHIGCDLPGSVTGLPESWTDRFLAALDWSAVDFLIPHYYNHFSTFLKGAPSEYLARVGATERMRAIIRYHQELIRKYSPGRPIELVSSEWNVHPRRSDDPEPHLTRDMAAALYAASALQVFAEEGVASAQFFQLRSGAAHHFGLLGDRDGTIRRPTYRVLRLYAEHSGPTRLESRVAGPAFEWRNPHNPGKEHWQVPYVDAMSTLAADGATLHLLLVNKDAGRACRAAVRVAGFAASGTGRAAVVDADVPETEEAAERQVRVETRSVAGGVELEIDLPPLSVTAVDLPGRAST